MVVFTHVIGVKYHGIKYIKHFLGPVWWLIPIVVVLALFGVLVLLSGSAAAPFIYTLF